MSAPPLLIWANASAAVVALLRTGSVTRFWPFGIAPKPHQDGYALPYAVWQSVYGAPANYLGRVPDADQAGIQVDAYATTVSEARAVSVALRDALEPHGYVVAYNGEDRESETGLYRVGFTAEFWTDR